MHTLIGLMGPMVSGKSHAARYLAEKFRTRGLGEVDVISTSDFLGKIANLIGEAFPTRSDKYRIGSFIDDYHAFKGGMVDAMAPLVENSAATLKIIDSVRNERQVSRWKELYPEIILIYLETDEPLRWQRNNIRRLQHNQTEISPDQFNEEQKLEIHGGIRQLRYKAQHEIINNSSMETYQCSLDEILDEYF
jgi:hypothetical protein